MVRGAALRAAWRPLAAAAVIALGLTARAIAPDATYAKDIWYVGLALTGAAVVWRTLSGALHGRFASDVVATLAIVAAVLLGQPLVGLVIVLMQTGGEALERYAMARASSSLATVVSTIETVGVGVLRMFLCLFRVSL